MYLQLKKKEKVRQLGLRAHPTRKRRNKGERGAKSSAEAHKKEKCVREPSVQRTLRQSG